MAPLGSPGLYNGHYGGDIYTPEVRTIFGVTVGMSRTTPSVVPLNASTDGHAPPPSRESDDAVDRLMVTAHRAPVQLGSFVSPTK